MTVIDTNFPEVSTFDLTSSKLMWPTDNLSSWLSSQQESHCWSEVVRCQPLIRPYQSWHKGQWNQVGWGVNPWWMLSSWCQGWWHQSCQFWWDLVEGWHLTIQLQDMTIIWCQSLTLFGVRLWCQLVTGDTHVNLVLKLMWGWNVHWSWQESGCRSLIPNWHYADIELQVTR